MLIDFDPTIYRLLRRRLDGDRVGEHRPIERSWKHYDQRLPTAGPGRNNLPALNCEGLSHGVGDTETLIDGLLQLMARYVGHPGAYCQRVHLTGLERRAQCPIGSDAALKPAWIEQYRQTPHVSVPEFDGRAIKHVRR